MHILLVEDDETTSEFVAAGLNEAGHVVDVLDNGKQALAQCMETEYNLLIVDRLLPGMDGLSLLKAIRALDIKAPAIFLTTMSGIDDKVEALEAGGDDYLTKPFEMPELIARINAVGRRPAQSTEQTKLQVADLSMDLLTRTVKRGNTTINLHAREFTLLEVLMRNENRIVSRTMLLEQVWEFNFDPKTSVVETHISRLRNKIDKPFDVNLLQNIRNVGYTLRLPTPSDSDE